MHHIEPATGTRHGAGNTSPTSLTKGVRCFRVGVDRRAERGDGGHEFGVGGGESQRNEAAEAVCADDRRFSDAEVVAADAHGGDVIVGPVAGSRARIARTRAGRARRVEGGRRVSWRRRPSTGPMRRGRGTAGWADRVLPRRRALSEDVWTTRPPGGAHRTRRARRCAEVPAETTAADIVATLARCSARRCHVRCAPPVRWLGRFSERPSAANLGRPSGRRTRLLPSCGTSCPGQDDLQRAGVTGAGEDVVGLLELVEGEVVGDEPAGVELLARARGAAASAWSRCRRARS